MLNEADLYSGCNPLAEAISWGNLSATLVRQAFDFSTAMRNECDFSFCDALQESGNRHSTIS